MLAFAFQWPAVGCNSIRVCKPRKQLLTLAHKRGVCSKCVFTKCVREKTAAHTRCCQMQTRASLCRLVCMCVRAVCSVYLLQTSILFATGAAPRGVCSRFHCFCTSMQLSAEVFAEVFAGETSGEPPVTLPRQTLPRQPTLDEVAVAHKRSMKSLERGLARAHIVM